MRFFTKVGVCTVVAALTVTAAAAQPVITSPTSSTVFKAGPDYATDVLQDPWDFNNAGDLSPSPDEFGGWTTSPANAWYDNGPGGTFLSAGRFRGTAAGDNQLMLLYRGDAVGLNPGRTGVNYPIDTAKYRKLAMKIRHNGAPAGPPFFQPAVYWYHASYANTNYLNRAGGALWSIIPPGDNTLVHTLDLTLAGTGGSQLVPACGGTGCTGTPATWAAEAFVRGFRVDPTTQSTSHGIEIDWVRLTASDSSSSAAMMTVTLSSCTTSSAIAVKDSDGVSTSVVSGGSTSSVSFNYGIFPPGNYSLVATCANGTSAEVPFSINAPPAVVVTDPDEVGDSTTDYAFSSSGGSNRWDFEESTLTDVKTLANVSTTAGACATTTCGIITAVAPATGKMLRASSVGATASQLGDPALDFLGGATTPLSSTHHRYLTFSMRINRRYDVAAGSVARVLWGSQSSTDQSSTTTSQDMRVWPGFNTYTIDLGALSVANGGIETECTASSPPCLTTPWGTRSIRFFRIDPHEFGDVATSFDIDNVSLNAPDEVNLSGSADATGSFTMRWTIADSDSTGSTYRSVVYLDSDRDASSGRTAISGATPLTSTIGTNTFSWTPPSTTAPGSYWISVDTTETRGSITHTETAYSTGPLVVFASTSTDPQISVSSPAANATVSFPFTISGCAYDQGNTSGINIDDIAIYATAGSGVTGTPAGTTYALGFGDHGLGTLQFAPLTPTTPVTCDSITNTASPFRNSGFKVVNVGLNQGPWTIRVFARSAISGRLTQISSDIPVTVSHTSGAPTNFQVTANGNTVTASWSAPTSGPAITGYVIDVSLNSTMTPLLFSQVLPVSITSGSGTLANGTYYLRVVSLISGARQGESETKSVRLGPAPPTLPGAPVLTATQVSSNPILLTWQPGTGGTPSNYSVIAGTTPGGDDLGTYPLGTATSISATAPTNRRIYVRVTASNAAGSATSNEINFSIGVVSTPPNAPTLNTPTKNGSRVTLSWTPGSGPAATGYTIQVRFSATGPVAMTLPASTTTFEGDAPAGTYFLSIVANNAAGSSSPSNQVTLVVP